MFDISFQQSRASAIRQRMGIIIKQVVWNLKNREFVISCTFKNMSRIALQANYNGTDNLFLKVSRYIPGVKTILYGLPMDNKAAEWNNGLLWPFWNGFCLYFILLLGFHKEFKTFLQMFILFITVRTIMRT